MYACIRITTGLCHAQYASDGVAHHVVALLLSRGFCAQSTRYNMVHFTPVNQIGGSGSAYSLSDQLAVDTQALGTRCVYSECNNGCVRSKDTPHHNSFVRFGLATCDRVF